MPYVVSVSYNVVGNYWVLLEAFTYTGKDYHIRVPAGFKFDLASIPRFFWRLIAPFELSLAASLVHDFLYQNGGKTILGSFTRSDADWIFLEIMREEGVVAWRRWAAYLAVRLFGKKAFRVA